MSKASILGVEYVRSFTRQWQRDYLLSLQERKSIKISANSNDVKKTQVGDIVILKEEEAVRCLWKLAKVTETEQRFSY